MPWTMLVMFLAGLILGTGMLVVGAGLAVWLLAQMDNDHEQP